MIRIVYINEKDIQDGLGYACGVLNEAKVAGRIFGFKDNIYLQEALGIIYGYIELAAALSIVKCHEKSLYVRDIANVNSLKIGKSHLANLPKIRLNAIEENPKSDFVLWNGRLLKYDDCFIPYFAGPGLADVELYCGDTVKLYYVTSGRQETLLKEEASMKRHNSSFPARRIEKLIFLFNCDQFSCLQDTFKHI